MYVLVQKIEVGENLAHFFSGCRTWKQIRSLRIFQKLYLNHFTSQEKSFTWGYKTNLCTENDVHTMVWD